MNEMERGAGEEKDRDGGEQNERVREGAQEVEFRR